MNDNTMQVKNDGRNVKRIREILGVKQEALAADLGVNQQRMSAIEQKELIDDDLMQQIADILKVPVEAIKNYDEEKAVNIVANTFHADNSSIGFAYNATINPIEKWIESLAENKKLYERLLQAEKEKNDLLQQIIDSKK